ncbi:MAG: hypothetical protein J5732_02550 [Bacteroidaceae bacterium]|nr:hypothetical protein [Bacteroidaceae bacterium]
MIQKITNGEYLKRVDNMSGEERLALMDRVGQWLRSGARLLTRKAEEPTAQLQNVMQISGDWNDAECQAWTEGVRLLTAFVGTGETWLPEMIYTKAAKRTIRRVVEILNAAGSSEVRQTTAGKTAGSASSKQGRGANAGRQTKKGTRAKKTQGKAEAQQNLKSCVPSRPKHIDQYIHLLPEKTQERAKQYGPLKREIEAARENMRLLMADPHSSNADREKWAKLAARNDEKIARINAELDREWEKVAATGRVVVDDLGMAHLLPAEEEKPDKEKRTKKTSAAVKAEARQTEDEKRREYLKKWLRDTRTNPSDERREQWKKNFKELLALGGEITDSIRKAGEYYGVELDGKTAECIQHKNNN